MKETSVLVLGIGNLLWADEGFGVRAVEALHRQYNFPDHVTLMDGGTQGLLLVPYVQQADVLIIFDAIDYGLPLGSLKVIRDQEVPKFLGAKKMSLHQTGFQEVLSTTELLGHYPSQIVLIGVQPVELEDYGGSLRPQVKAQINPAIQVALTFLAELGIQAEANFPQPDEKLIDAAEELSQSSELSASGLAIHAYENDRPSEVAACRLGDSRVLTSAEVEFDPKEVLEDQGKLSINLELRRQD